LLFSFCSHSILRVNSFIYDSYVLYWSIKVCNYTYIVPTSFFLGSVLFKNGTVFVWSYGAASSWALVKASSALCSLKKSFTNWGSSDESTWQLKWILETILFANMALLSILSPMKSFRVIFCLHRSLILSVFASWLYTIILTFFSWIVNFSKLLWNINGLSTRKNSLTKSY